MYVIFYANPSKAGEPVLVKKYFESKQIDEVLLTIKKHLNIDNDENSTVFVKCFEYITIKETERQNLLIGDETGHRKADKKDIYDFL